jgi:hypothetical protein
MNVGRVLRILFALALLNAQQAALAHQIWHFGDPGTHPAQSELCGQHDGLGTVAGALDCPIDKLSTEAPSEFLHWSVAPPSAATPGLAPSSRGPPVLL